MGVLDTAKKVIDISKGYQTSEEEPLGVSSNFYRRNWIKYNDKWYYLKKGLRDEYIINEFIGVELCRYFGIPTIDYLIYKKGKYYGLMSLNMFDKRKEYISSLDFKKKYKDTLYNLMGKLDCELALDFLKIALIDYYMGEQDRNYGNIILRKENECIKVDTVLDFSLSYMALGDNHYLYHSNLKTYDLLNGFYTKVLESIPIIRREYEESKEIFKRYEDIDMGSILDKIQEQYGIYINGYMKNNCINYGNESKRRVLELL